MNRLSCLLFLQAADEYPCTQIHFTCNLMAVTSGGEQSNLSGLQTILKRASSTMLHVSA